MSKANSRTRLLLKRREALLLSAAGIGATLTTAGSAMDSTKTAAHQEPGHCSTPRSAVANTQYGKVHGFLDGGVFTFKGVPYAYYFTWQTPILDGLPGAWHTADLQFCFDNTKRCEQGTGNTIEAQALAKKMATAWANFAAGGNPSQPDLTWTPTDPDSNKAMVWDNDCRMVDDPEGEARKILLS